MGDGDRYRGTRQEVERAIRRLSVLEFLFFFAALSAVVGGGWAAAYLLTRGNDLPFGPTWALVSALLVAVPAALAFARTRANDERNEQRRNDQG